MMAVNDFVRRSMQIVAGGIKESTVDYFDNAITFVNDAKEIKDRVMQGARSSKETFDSMRHVGIGKKFRDWFYNEGGMFGDFDFSDEDFDAGFEIDSADDDSKESSKPLTQDSMQDVAKKQTGAIYKALGKTADLHMANTAEIVSTINSRSAELTASVNNINNTLIQIGKRLDMIVEYTTARTKQEQKEERKNSIFDYNGGISVSGLTTGLKEVMSDSMVMTMLSMGKTMLGSGMLTPEMILSMVLSQTILDKQFKGLGDKSINDIGEAINDTIGSAIQNGLTKVLTSKNDFLHSIFGDLIYGPAKKNFRDFAQNQYNDKPAVFDGMTRKSIITIIPGYLNEILKAVSHTDGMSIDKKGNLTSKKTDHFVNEVADNLFKPGSMDHDRRNKILTAAKAYDANISSSDISEAMRALTGAWLWYMYQSGRQVLEVGETTDITRESTQRVISNASMLLSTQTGRSSDYWKEILQYCVFQLDESSFRQDLQKQNQKAFKNLSDFAKNRDNNSQARAIGKQEFLDAYKRQYSMYHSEPGKAYEPPSPVTETSVGSTKPTTLTSLDYLSGIFKILNRGLNVYVTGSSRRQKKPYDPIDVKPGDGYVSSIGNLHSVNNNNTDIIPAQQTPSLSSSLVDSDPEKKEPETEEEKLLATPDNELSPEDLKRKRKLMKGKRKEKYKGLKERYETWRNNGYKLKGSVINPWNFLDDIISPEAREAKNKAKEKYDEFKESETGQKISNSEVVKTTKNLGSFISDKIFGEKTTDEEGNSTRSGGLLSGIASQASKIKSDMSGVASNISDKFTSKEELQSRFSEASNPYTDESSVFASAEDREDQNIVKTLNMLVQTAISDGDYSSIDEREIVLLINKIHDQKLKQQMRRSLLPLLRKQGKKMEGIEIDKPKSGIGKFISFAIMGIKKVFAPVVGLINKGISTIFKLVKGFGKKMLSIIGKNIKTGFQRMYYGAKSLASGTVGLFKNMYSAFTKLTKPMKWISEKALGLFGKVKSRFQRKGNTNDSDSIDEESDSENKKEGFLSRTKNKLSNVTKKLGEKARNNSFVSGFLEARDNRKKANLRDKAPETVGDQAAVDIRAATEDIEGVLNNETDEGKGFTRPIIRALNNVIDAIKGENETEQTETSQTEIDSDKVKDPDEKQNNNTTQMEELNMNSTSTDLGSSNNANATGSAQMSDVSEIANTNNDNSDEGKKKGGVMNNIGKMLGGISSMMGGLLQIVLSIVMSLEGFKAIYDLIMTTLTSSLKPLNNAFQMILKVLKPFIKELGSIMKMISEFVVEIVNVVVDIIQPILQDIVKPILEALSPVLDILMETMTPILSILGIVLKVILAPWFGIIKHTLVPIIRIIGDAVQIIMGVLQIGLGGIMTILGTIGIGIGGILSGLGKLIPIVGDKISEIGGNISDSAHDMQSQGLTFMKNGAKSTLTGATNMVIDTASIILPSTLTDKMRDAADNAIDKGVDKAAEVVQEKVVDKVNDKLENGLSDYIDEKTGNNASPEGSDGDHRSTVVTTYGSGDISNSWIYNTYGGEYQRGMGGYLNMNQRGCGPIALADAYNRRGGNLSARSLAASMVGSGAYDPNKGTSVGSFMSTSKSLGMNVRAGGVTQQSLKRATPNNPITVIGSGSDYGTRRGNNHFMNVIGTDSHGGAYVSNPLTGRIDRKPASTIAGSSVVGIYGAGDEGADGGYSFPDSIRDAFKALKAQAAKILGLFSMEDSEEDQVNEIINESQNEEANRQARAQLGDEKYKEYEVKAKEMAFEDYKKKYPKPDGQSDEEYQVAFEKWCSKVSSQYLSKSGLLEEAKESATGNDSPWQTIITNYGSEDSEFFKTMESAGGSAYDNIKSMETLSSSNIGGSGYFTSNKGVPLWTPYSDNIEITETNIQGDSDYHSPLFEFFAKTMGLKLGDIHGSGWFSQYNKPNTEGVGSDGDDHSGVDFTGGSIEGKPLYATTSGEVVLSQYQSDGAGNYIVWQDSAGQYHWYMHMAEPSTFKVGDEISGGDLLGYVGSTGRSTGPHLHYTINDSLAKSGAGNVQNPLTYFNNYNPMGGNYGVASGSTDEEKIFSYLVTSGMTPIGASGLMGCFKYESDMRTNNLENSYNDQFGLSDEEYTSRVDSGAETEDQFVSGRNATAWSGQTPGEAVGYGIAQFTSSNLKRGIYDRTVKQGKSIASLEPQLDSIIDVLKERGIYDTINNAKTPTDANKTFLWKYEAGTGYTSDEAVLRAYPWMLDSTPDGTQLRHQYADKVYNTFKNWTPASATKSSPTGKGSVSTGFNMVTSADDAKKLNNFNAVQSITGQGKGIVNTREDDLNLRSSPSTDSSILSYIPTGTEIDIFASDNPDWYKTSYNGQTGYVYKDFINLITSDADTTDYTINRNKKKDQKKYDKPIGPDKPDWLNNNDLYGPKPEPTGTDGGSGIYNMDNIIHKETKTTTITGSGDKSSIGSDFWGPYIGWDNDEVFNNGYSDSSNIPPIDDTKLLQYVDDTANGHTILNRYNIIRTEDKTKEDQIRIILQNTYNVRSESIEALLMEILEYLKKKDPKGTNNGTNGSTKLFDERIPAQVAKLSIG